MPKTLRNEFDKKLSYEKLMEAHKKSCENKNCKKDIIMFNLKKEAYYLEEFFIEKGVRFIAVTDDIDTGHIETSEEMVQFKAFFNEWFLRDTSRKVRNGKKTRAKEGKVMTTYPTYRI